MIDASSLSKLKQALLSFGIRVFVFAALLGLDYISAGLSNGSVQLPDPALLLPVLTLIISEADTWLVNWSKANNVPVPTVSQ